MKKIVIIGMMLCMAFVNNACAAKKSTQNLSNIEIEESTEKKVKLEYHKIVNEINSYMDELRDLYTSSVLEDDGVDANLVVRTGMFDMASTEGNIVKQYEKNNGEILRYSILQFGEMGSTGYEYYKIKEDISYVTVVEMIYSAPINLGGDIDVLRNIQSDYIIFDNKLYYLDKYEEKLLEIKSSDDVLPFITFQDLTKEFIETNE